MQWVGMGIIKNKNKKVKWEKKKKSDKMGFEDMIYGLEEKE